MHSWVLSLFLVWFLADNGDIVSASDLSNLLQKISKSLSERDDLNVSQEMPEKKESYRIKNYNVKAKEMYVPQHLEHRGRSVSVSKRGNGVIVKNTNIYHPSDTTKTQSVEDMCVDAHNYVRALHGVADLTWSSKLGDEAAEYAKYMADTGDTSHSSGDYGENLYMSANNFGAISSAAHAVYAWYSESWRPNYSTVDKNYNYTFNPTDEHTFRSARIGHFTAVVWKDTTQVGCGVASIVDKGMTKTYIVARYTSEGNVLGNFPSNVLPLKSGDASMNGQLDVIDLVEGITDCGDFVSSSTCSRFSAFCSIVGPYCDCAC